MPGENHGLLWKFLNDVGQRRFHGMRVRAGQIRPANATAEENVTSETRLPRKSMVDPGECQVP